MTRTLRQPIFVMAAIVFAAMWFAAAAQAGAPTYSPPPQPRPPLQLDQPPQMACGSRTIIIKSLREKYGETRKGAGISGNELIEVWATHGGTFTILKTYPDGMACFVVVGSSWRDFMQKTPINGEGEGA